MNAAVPRTFVCNICGADCDRPAEGLAREIPDCASCGSSVRLRALIALLSQELFGVPLALPEFPALKGIRGLGMSDSPNVASRLAQKLDYTNTFYHQAPAFDVTQPDERDRGRYDFILSSEVMEHVPPPVERAFGALCQLLKPDGLLLLTTPYSLGGNTAEHFPSLHQYSLTEVAGRPVLLNRRADGSTEVFENLNFHGGHGSTIEMRTFTEDSLRALLVEAGFASVHFAARNWPEFGIEHAETWSLPVAARKGHFHPPTGDLTSEYREACRRAARAQHDLEAITAEYHRHAAFHALSHAEMERQLAARVEWTRKVEREHDERTRWALDLEREKNQAIADFEHAEKERQATAALVKEAHRKIETLEQELDAAQKELARLKEARWTQLGRRLRMIRF